MRKNVLIASVFILCSLPLEASSTETPSYISRHVEEAFPVGHGRMHYLLWDLYDAKLYAPKGLLQNGCPMALSITYLHDLKGQKIAEKSIELMQNQGLTSKRMADNWRAKMSEIFPNVQKGSNLTGVRASDGTTIFYHDGKEAGRIADPEFGSRFFAIWLSPETTEPQLRYELLGMSNSKE